MTARLILFGPPGVGKGTQGTLLSKALGVPAISTGDLFRHHIQQQDELGRSVAATLAAGGLVDDTVTTAMVKRRLGSIGPNAGFVLDGYPRTMNQAADLEGMLHGQDQISAVALIEAPTEVLIERLLKRAQQQSRVDDTIEVITKRLEVYSTTTTPLIERYEALGLVVRIDGTGSVEAVQSTLMGAVSAHPAA